MSLFECRPQNDSNYVFNQNFFEHNGYAFGTAVPTGINGNAER